MPSLDMHYVKALKQFGEALGLDDGPSNQRRHRYGRFYSEVLAHPLFYVNLDVGKGVKLFIREPNYSEDSWEVELLSRPNIRVEEYDMQRGRLLKKNAQALVPLSLEGLNEAREQWAALLLGVPLTMEAKWMLAYNFIHADVSPAKS